MAREASSGNRCSRLHAAFMDFTQAYDHVDRQALWAHLNRIGMPPHLLGAIQAMYLNDRYILVDGVKVCPPVTPTRGVKQGCPLSPLLFALFINDFQVPPDLGVKLHGLSRKVSHMFYADDLCLLSNSAAEVRRMLSILEQYSRAKGLTVNAGKSCVVVFNSRGVLSSQELGFAYEGACLEVVNEFKYLGVVFHRDGNMSHVDRHRARSLMVATIGSAKLAKEHGVDCRVDVMLQLFQTYAISQGLYAAHVWCTPFLHQDKAFESLTQLQHLSFLRRLTHAREAPPVGPF